jgi:DNA-binding transcriptional LysR family regulator
VGGGKGGQRGGDQGTCEVWRDRLVLAASPALADWRDNWLVIEWGTELGDAIASAVGLPENRGLSLDLGGRAVNWLVERQGSGFVPEHLARPMIDQGRLRLVDDMPGFDLAAHAVWRARSDAPTGSLVDSLLAFTANLPAPVA